MTAALAAASMPEDADAVVQHVYTLLGAEGVGSAAARQVRRAHANARLHVAASRAAVLPHGLYGRAWAE